MTDNASSVWLGVWSPDGRQIAYTVSSKSGMSVWVMNFDGSRPHQVTHLTPQQGAAQMPAWSPDGQQLAFQANATTPRKKATLWIVDLRTSAAREVLPHDNGFLDETPTWFSDGKRLAFQSNRSGSTEVWAVDTDNSDAAAAGVHRLKETRGAWQCIRAAARGSVAFPRPRRRSQVLCIQCVFRGVAGLYDNGAGLREEQHNANLEHQGSLIGRGP